ncbi:MAG: hypothetical protein AAFV80_07760, partial [Bacteroidota bacterium]
ILIIRHWSKLPLAVKTLGIFLAWNFFIEMASRALQFYEINNLPLLHAYTLGEFILFSLFFYSLEPIKNWNKAGRYIFLTLGSVFILLNSLFLQPITGFNSYAKSFVQIAIISYSLVLFFFLIGKETIHQTSHDKPLKWINAGILTYYCGSLFIFMFSDFFYDEGQHLPAIFWFFNSVLNLTFQVIVLYALWKICQKTPKYSS